jgi:hypothetical protein
LAAPSCRSSSPPAGLYRPTFAPLKDDPADPASGDGSEVTIMIVVE